ncbi:lysine-epsilon-oxidase maturase LodB [Candidatus Nitrosacidococcus tergens]|uniref:Monooxygenase FAD-binding protein n=1 Tax=Candidatus Nitrosacidococcus tergens TaxID=553981 RepID=A0A7G1Q874_9GAMM|nr:lysine-epsilon-oxidase maturase LodB [Candidatus Nitrosacidococcus tergens]CAB1274480.1 Monooxygenase FAD-binding protein [Candidatus Nitrosacidococcus tergens]
MDRPLLGEVDVAIIGGGPAGSSCGLTLRTYKPTYRVALIESSTYNATRLGENVSSALLPLLSYLEIKEHLFSQTTYRECFAVKAYWGNNTPLLQHSLRHWMGESYLLDRQYFDVMLAETFCGRGGKLYLSCRVEAILPLEDKNVGYLLQLRHRSGKQFALSARFLVDATGRKANIARKLGAISTRYDSLIGVSRFFSANSATSWSQDIIIESAPEGWWYSAPLPENRLVVTLMTDAKLWREQRQDDNLGYWELLLKQAPNSYTRIRQAALTADTKLTLRLAHTHVLNEAIGKNWLSVGDAAVSFDPLSSLGIGFSMHSGCHAARAIVSNLESREIDSLCHYNDSIKKQFTEYLPIWQRYYRYENRYSYSPFWKTRHEQP